MNKIWDITNINPNEHDFASKNAKLTSIPTNINEFTVCDNILIITL